METKLFQSSLLLQQFYFDESNLRTLNFCLLVNLTETFLCCVWNLLVVIQEQVAASVDA